MIQFLWLVIGCNSSGGDRVGAPDRAGDSGDSAGATDTAGTAPLTDTGDTPETSDTSDTAGDSACVTHDAWLDRDADGFGDEAWLVPTCTDGAGLALKAGDCDDYDPSAFPGGMEGCGGGDEDCDGEVDEAGAIGEFTWYTDSDADGYGDAAATRLGCVASATEVSDGTDCDDTLASVSPGAVELCGGGDEDCDGLADDDDTSPGGQVSWFIDLDGDGWGDAAAGGMSCVAPAGSVSVADDCDDSDGTVSPDGVEVCGSGDEDCDGLTNDDDPTVVDPLPWFVDGDGDGYGSSAYSRSTCVAPVGFVADATDCDDGDATLRPGAGERCDGIDEDCNGLIDDLAVDAPTWYADLDGDTYGDPLNSAVECEAPAGYLSEAQDCDDTDATVLPGATEVCDDTVDQDCDGHERPCQIADLVVMGDAGDIWLGESMDDRAGHSAGWAGDTDGDGLDEAAFGAYREDSAAARAGAVYLVSTTGGVESIFTTAAAKLTGEAEGDHFGSAIAGVGDTDGDGLDDLVVGAWLAAPDYSGAAYLFTGPVASLGAASATGIFRGEADDDEAGTAVGAAGDLNGDGLGDVAVGAPYYDGTAASAGEAVVFFGGSSGSLSLSAGDVRVQGEGDHDTLGRAFGGRGDLNGDGSDDLVVGAPGAYDSGAVYVLSGPLSGDIDAGDADAVAIGTSEGDQLGFAVRILGDTDLDGYDDVGAGAPGAAQAGDTAGEAWLLLGPLSGTLSAGDATAIRYGDAAGDQAGCSMGGGDADGDGRADMAYGAWAEDSNGPVAGAVYIELGPFSGTGFASDGYAMIVGSGGAIEAGRSVGLDGDIDGDGLGDLAIGAPDLSTYYNGAGGGFVLLGSTLAAL